MAFQVIDIQFNGTVIIIFSRAQTTALLPINLVFYSKILKPLLFAMLPSDLVASSFEQSYILAQIFWTIF